MAIEIFNRTEEKYLLTPRQARRLLEAAKNRLTPDPYCRDGQAYLVENIYFDTADDELISRAVEKNIFRQKLRLRSYGIPAPQSTVFLEIKKKYEGIGNKRRTGMSLATAEAYLEDGKRPDPDTPGINALVLEEIDYLRRTRDLTPKAMITYERQAWFSAADPGLRLTFDRNILAREDELYLGAGPGGRPLLTGGKILFELKAEVAVPMWLAREMAQMKIWPVTFSKYAQEYITREPEAFRDCV